MHICRAVSVNEANIINLSLFLVGIPQGLGIYKISHSPPPHAIYKGRENATIMAESVGPLRRIYQSFSPFPIYNVDPHYTGADALLSPALKQGMERRSSNPRQRV